jgi:hypothetical protein
MSPTVSKVETVLIKDSSDSSTRSRSGTRMSPPAAQPDLELLAELEEQLAAGPGASGLDEA